MHRMDGIKPLMDLKPEPDNCERDVDPRDHDMPSRDHDMPPRDQPMSRDQPMPPRDHDMPSRDHDMPSRDLDIPARDRRPRRDRGRRMRSPPVENMDMDMNMDDRETWRERNRRLNMPAEFRRLSDMLDKRNKMHPGPMSPNFGPRRLLPQNVPRVSDLPHLPPHVDEDMLTRSPCELDSRSELWIGMRTFQMKIGDPPKRIMHMGLPIVVRIEKTGEVKFNSRVVYGISRVPADVEIGRTTCKVFYQGAERRIWIDGEAHEIRFDAPPLQVQICNSVHDLHANSFTDDLVIDGAPVAKFGDAPQEITLGADTFTLSFSPPPRDILIDDKVCQLRLEYPIPVILVDNRPHGVCFKGPPRKIVIDNEQHMLFTREVRIVKIAKRAHKIGLLGPGHELIIDGRTYDVKFGGQPRDIRICNKIHSVILPGQPPELDILAPIPIDPVTNQLMLIPGDHPLSEAHQARNRQCNAPYNPINMPFDANVPTGAAPQQQQPQRPMMNQMMNQGMNQSQRFSGVTPLIPGLVGQQWRSKNPNSHLLDSVSLGIFQHLIRTSTKIFHLTFPHKL